MTVEDANRPWEKVRGIWEIIDRLRAPDGCPWDRKQTPESVQTYLVEEAHEAAAAVRSGDLPEAAEELGDLLFMVLFLVHLYNGRGDFDLAEVADRITEKMIRRHPHVFSDVKVHSTREVRDNWEKIKAKEKSSKGQEESTVPESLPALMRAYRMLSRLAQKDGSPWSDPVARAEDFARESEEASRNFREGHPVSADAFGRLFALLVNLARLQGYRAEDCLHAWLRTLEPPAPNSPQDDAP